MLNFGERGILITPKLEKTINEINDCLKDIERLKLMSIRASEWSQKYTLDLFESEIIKLLKP